MNNKDFLYYAAASYPILWVNTFEYERAIKELAESVKKINHTSYKWDLLSGIIPMEKKSSSQKIENQGDPMQPITFIEGKQNTIVFVQDFHLYIKGAEIWRKLLNNIDEFKKNSNMLVIVSPVVDVPIEIERYITVMDFALPEIDELKSVLENICNDLEIEYDHNSKETEEIINNGKGLTCFEFENAICSSMAKNGKIIPSFVHKQKEQLIKRSSNLTICKTDHGFEALAGMENIKYFAKKMVESKKGKGILLVGVPGAGKTAFTQALGKETGRITIQMDFGNLQGGIVGETEKNTKNALSTADAMEPCILQADEIEKGLAGVSGHNGDSGTSKRQGGQFLKWMSDHKSDVYLVATSNNIRELPPEFLRAERWDAIFFFDLPTEEERSAILKLYMDYYKINKQDVPDITNWTGAEIKTLCRLSSAMEIPLLESAQYVCPISKTMEGKIKELREWADGKTVPASLTINKKSENKNKRAVKQIN